MLIFKLHVYNTILNKFKLVHMLCWRWYLSYFSNFPISIFLTMPTLIVFLLSLSLSLLTLLHTLSLESSLFLKNSQHSLNFLTFSFFQALTHFKWKLPGQWKKERTDKLKKLFNQYLYNCKLRYLWRNTIKNTRQDSNGHLKEPLYKNL